MVDILSGIGPLPEVLFSIFISAVLLALFVSIFALCIFFMYVIFEKLQDLYDRIKRKLTKNNQSL